MLNVNPAFVAASATFSSWTGWIVPRIIPSETTTSKGDTEAKSIQAATSKRSVDPCLLCPERGLNFHPFAPGQQQAIRQEEYSKPDTNNLAPIVVPVDDQSQSTILDVYIFPPTTNQTDITTGSSDPLHVRMDRNSQEFVNQTLKRMILSVNKQISKKLKPKGKKQKQQKPTNNTITDDSVSIYKDKSSSLGTDTPWNVQNLTNQQVWAEAMATPLQVTLALENEVTLSLNVDSCPPTIVTVETFEDFTAGVFCHVPLTVEVQSLFTCHVVVDWYLDNQLVSKDCNSYTPQEHDIGKTVSVLITPLRKDHSGRGYEEAYRYVQPVEALPENTVIKIRQDDTWTNPNRRDADSNPLRVLTYNILADQNAYERTGSGKTVSCYPYVELSTLDKKRRMPLLLHEILSYQADLICLQEVDENIWRRLFRPALEQAGYQGYFSTKVAQGMSEGCALLWSLQRFESIPKEEMKFYGISDLIQETISNQDDKWKSARDMLLVLARRPDLHSIINHKLGHVVQMASLPLLKKSESTPDRILVANTHLFYHPYGAHIRLMQMYAICQQFERFRSEAQAPYPMIVCGDMNSSLRRAAGYLLIHRRVESDHSQIREHFNTFEWRDRPSPSSAKPKGPPATQRVEHTEKDKEGEDHWKEFPSIQLPEHFPSFVTGYPTEPEFTHLLDKFKGSLDHIFISQSSKDNPYGFSPLRSAPMPTVADATELVAMPSEKFPSDHVSLVTDLQFTKKS